MCEDDDLTCLRLQDQSSRHAVAPLEVQGGYRIVEHDARRVISRTEFGKERGNGKAALLAFTHHFGQIYTRRTSKNQLVVKDAIGSAKLQKGW